MNKNNSGENTELTNLPNIGKEIKKQLNAVGINTPEDLLATGSREAWLKIRAIDASACYNRLCGLEGAIQGIRWHYLDDNLKKELKSFYEANR
ncbi:TfoX/Sxy family protein [Acetobacterium woodii]|uniref:TfoX domain-containing protein n=1 Tax=Acetobacterium woodii (strain ATCC 29683 / DSM 1030 / JCM 2381 / KCTC 1655 / WB1) TaxID=931626 RepID=H6LIA4_ACEWD|nr:TfoX/Sxy family protein [Acetobacterium woodii]AFA47278.1 TfoX domain-containing protein [Acetobacterium woodii DSM 1030]